MTVEQALRRDLVSLANSLGEIVHYVSPEKAGIVKPLPIMSEGQHAQTAFRDAFSSQNSDKTTTHSYQEAYPQLLTMLGPVHKVCEIGIGARHPSGDRTDGWPGTAGGSLHAWSSVTRGAQVLGLDIDPRLDREAPNVFAMAMDSLNRESVKSVAQSVSQSWGTFDLIVDDGLHVPQAQISNMLHFFTLVRPGGFYVVEDLHDTSATAITHIGSLLGVQEAYGYSRRESPYGQDNALVAYRMPKH